MDWSRILNHHISSMGGDNSSNHFGKYIALNLTGSLVGAPEEEVPWCDIKGTDALEQSILRSEGENMQWGKLHRARVNVQEVRRVNYIKKR